MRGSSLSENSSSEHDRRISLTNSFALTIACIAAPYFFVFGSVSKPLSWIIPPLVIAFLSTLILNKFHFYNLSRFLLLLTSCFAVMFYACSIGKEAGIQFLFFSFIGAPMVIFEPHERLKLVTGISIPVISFLITELTQYGLFPRVSTSPSYQEGIYYSAIVFVLLISLLLFRYTVQANLRMETKLKNTNDDLQIAYSSLKARKEEAEQMSRQISYATLTKGIAHEIKNPLAMLQSRAELLLSKEPNQEQVKKFADITLRNIERLKRLIQVMLEYGGPVSKEKNEFSIKGLIEDVIELTEHKCKRKGIELSHKFDPVPDVFGDKTFIAQAVLNVIANAIQVSEKGDTISINLKQSMYKNPQSALVSGVLVTISDSGPGIDPSIIDQIFDPYFTTKSSTTNIGLGLSMVYRVITENNGKVEVNSSHGSGTNFLIYLPSASVDN